MNSFLEKLKTLLGKLRANASRVKLPKMPNLTRSPKFPRSKAEFLEATGSFRQKTAKFFKEYKDPVAIAGWAQSTFQRQNAGTLGLFATIFLCCYFLADLTALLLENYIPEPPVSHVAQRGFTKRKLALEDYNVIFTRNLFNSQGLIPGESSMDSGGTPVRTSLPFNLIGTLILKDELRSIATIEDKSAQAVYPVRQEDEIPGKAKILKVEDYKVIFINTATGRREFVDMPEDQIQAPRISVSAKTPGSSGPSIEQVGNHQFAISRTEVDKTLADLNNVLTQARCVPNLENGAPAGYKCFQIVPGSIYDKLGMQNGDIICGLNGENVNDPGRAFELLSQLKTASHIELCIKRNGVTSNFAYDIH